MKEMLGIILVTLAQSAVVVDSVPFAQGVEYRIEARVEETTDILHGRAELRYTNNAPAALDTLWLHQHLNAFRPESEWARRELEYGERRFQDLGPDDHAFERLVSVTIDGVTVAPVYPLSPDSSVVGLPLSADLATGSTVVVRMDWDARLSTRPRRQGRSGRHFDFAQWYPRIAVYDRGGWQVQPLMPQGEFYGEFGSYDVTLEVATDQVIGATGVPVEGDPGWAARARPGYDEILYNREVYLTAPASGLGFLAPNPPSGQKRVRWRGEEIHHFAWSMNPEYIYEGARVARTGPAGGEIGIHVLYWPSDVMWANGVALDRTVRTLEWLQNLFGPYLWPQVTNLHRLESGATEFPMMMMNGSASEGLIMHEGVHLYFHGILANNEFDEGWIDEGFASFITDWYHEEHGATNVWDGQMASIRAIESAGRSEVIAQPGADFSTPNIYSAMTYTKTSLVLRMLRWMIGEDAMREVLREFYNRHALQHVTEADLRAVIADVTEDEIDWFFDQWFHSTHQLDYAVAGAATTQIGDEWVTRVEVQRSGDAWMPVALRVGEVEHRLTSRDRVQVVEVRTDQRPDVVVLDPENVLIDINPGNNSLVVR